MEFTCLSQGKGFYCPPCHILDVSGFRILFDCPLDLSSLTIFSPLLPNIVSSCVNYHDQKQCTCSCQTTSKVLDNKPKPFDVNALIRAEPRYKTVSNLLLWNVGFIDVVLISSPMAMLGLPFLTRNKDFSAKVYVTEVAGRIGCLMMEDLVSMNKEFRQFYGPESDVPEWMKWEEIDLLPLELKKIVVGDDGTEFAGWMPLYSAAEVKDCMAKTKSLKYGEEACYNGTLIVKPFSSGLDIGACNWSITSPKGSISYISGSISMSATAMGFDYKTLQSDVILYSDISSCNSTENLEDNSVLSDNVDLEESFTKLNEGEYLEETEKFDFIFSCSMDSVKAGGSVLIPIGRLGGILQLLERFALGLESENVKVPIYLVSSVAEEILAFCNVIPEWLCRERQDKLYSGQSLFIHVEMLKDRRLHVYPAIHSLELLKNWQEPCIVFCPHWSLRLGPVVHLLHRWSKDQNSLLIMEEGVDANLALLPFKPITMKVLQCSFLSGLKPQHSQLLLKILQPQHVLFPEVLKRHAGHLESLFILGYYAINKTLNIPFMKESELDIAIEVVAQLHYSTLKEENLAVSRLKGELVMEQGRHRLFLENEPGCSETSTRQVLSFGRIDSGVLVKALRKIGMNVTVDNNSEASIVRVSEPHEALIQVTESETLISTADENVASLISQAVCGILDCLR